MSYGHSSGAEASTDTEMQHPSFDERFLSFTSLDQSSLRHKASRGSSSGGLAEMFVAQGARTSSPESLDFAMMVQPLADPLDCGTVGLSPERDWVSAYMRESKQEDDRRVAAWQEQEAAEACCLHREQDAARQGAAGTESTSPLTSVGRLPPHPTNHQQQQQFWPAAMLHEEHAVLGPRHYSCPGSYGPPPYLPGNQDAGVYGAILNTPQGTFANPILPFQHLSPPIDRKKTASLPLSAAQTTLRNFLRPYPQHPVQEDPLQQTRAQGVTPQGTGPPLVQSNLQLSLGLGADAPINFQAWQYGGVGGPLVPLGSMPPPANRPAVHLELDSADTSSQGGRLLPPVESAFLDEQDAVPGMGAQAPPASSPRTKAEPQCSDSHMAAPDMARRQASIGNSMDSAVQRYSMASTCGTSVQSGLMRSHEEGLSRAECLERYRDKKRRRVNCKTIRYHKRKVNADARPRIKGRFVKTGGPAAEGKAVGDEPAISADEADDEGESEVVCPSAD